MTVFPVAVLVNFKFVDIPVVVGVVFTAVIDSGVIVPVDDVAVTFSVVKLVTDVAATVVVGSEGLVESVSSVVIGGGVDRRMSVVPMNGTEAFYLITGT